MSLAVPSSKPSFWRTVSAVAWSFLGLRGRRGHEQDARNVNPLHLVLVGLIAIFLFVGALMLLVNWMVR